MNYLVAFDKDYYIPDELVSRFTHLFEKIKRLNSEKEKETATGYKIVFDDEFQRYFIHFRKGSFWSKKTESWQGNDPKGTLVKIVRIKGSFIWYKKGVLGKKFILNKLSFLNIFEEVRNENRKSFWFI